MFSLDFAEPQRAECRDNPSLQFRDRSLRCPFSPLGFSFNRDVYLLQKLCYRNTPLCGLKLRIRFLMISSFRRFASDSVILSFPTALPTVIDRCGTPVAG